MKAGRDSDCPDRPRVVSKWPLKIFHDCCNRPDEPHTVLSRECDRPASRHRHFHMIVSIPWTYFGLGRSIRSGRLYFALYLECLFRVLRIVKGPDVLVIMNSRPHEIKGSRIKWVMLHSHREHFFVTGAVAVATQFHTISHLFPFLKGKWPFRVSGLRASCFVACTETVSDLLL